MKNFYLVLLAATILVSCKKNKYITNTVGNNFSENTSSAYTNVRVQNSLSIGVFNTSVQNINFGDLEPESASSFKNIGCSLANATCSFTINGKTISVKSTGSSSSSHSCGSSSSSSSNTEAGSGNYTLLIAEPSPGTYTVSVSRN